MSLPDVLPYINSTVLTGIVGGALTYIYRRRKLDIDEHNAGRTADREEIERLRNALRQLQDDMQRRDAAFHDELTKQRRDCEAEQEHLRGEIRALHEEIMGMRRQRTQEQLSAVSIMPASPALVDAAEQLKKLA